jgi:hypothetical protein
MVASFSGWLHDGELNVITRYRRPWTALVIWSMAVALSPVLFVGSRSERLIVGAMVMLLVGVGVLSWKRRIAILTPTAILFRPMFGTPLRLPLNGIKRVSRSEKPSGEGGWIEFCRLEFLVGGFLDIPWGYSGDLGGDVERLIASN